MNGNVLAAGTAATAATTNEGRGTTKEYAHDGGGNRNLHGWL